MTTDSRSLSLGVLFGEFVPCPPETDGCASLGAVNVGIAGMIGNDIVGIGTN